MSVLIGLLILSPLLLAAWRVRDISNPRHRHVWEDCVITGAGFTLCRCACGETVI